MDGKRQPIVIDIVDHAGPLKGFAEARTKKYRALGYEVRR
jgi:hypothetical protein